MADLGDVADDDGSSGLLSDGHHDAEKPKKRRGSGKHKKRRPSRTRDKIKKKEGTTRPYRCSVCCTDINNVPLYAIGHRRGSAKCPMRVDLSEEQYQDLKQRKTRNSGTRKKKPESLVSPPPLPPWCHLDNDDRAGTSDEQ